jgi:hypothetical protein
VNTRREVHELIDRLMAIVSGSEPSARPTLSLAE